MQPLADELGGAASSDLLGPLRPPRHPRRAPRASRLPALRSATGLARSRFSGARARALLAGNAAHSMQPLERPATAAFGLMLLLLGHGVGWPAAVGGSQAIADAMASLLRSLGGEIETGVEVRSLDELRGARARALRPHAAAAARDRRRRAARAATAARSRASATAPASSSSTTRSTGRCRGARPSAGGPARCTSAGRSRRSPRPRREVARGGHPQRPFVLVAQQSLFDPSRAPGGRAHAVGLLPRARTARAST